MNTAISFTQRSILFRALNLFLAGMMLAGCGQGSTPVALIGLETTPTASTPEPDYTPQPTRQTFEPGELVDYIAQTGDTLDVLAVHFNTSVDEIREANPSIPTDVTTLPPGFPMKIPIYQLPLYGTSYQIIPDDLYVDGPDAVGFDTQAFIDAHDGWLKGYVEYAVGDNRSAGNVIDLIAGYYSVSPRVLLALLEFQAGGLSQATAPDSAPYYLGKDDYAHKGLYLQLGWAANALNNAYYDWRMGRLNEIDLIDGRFERPDPWQNAATMALHAYFSQLYSGDEYERAVSEVGFAQTYTELFGDPWTGNTPHIPGMLQQPSLLLPFEPNTTWAYTGGPHTGWGNGAPWAAIDFAPPSTAGGCVESNEWVTAVAAGVIVRREEGIAVLDLDGDGDERTGWVIFYLHLASKDAIELGTVVQAGQRIGHPSCERGNATGTHIHIARKYNGEWLSAFGTMAFNLEGWIVQEGDEEYDGSMTKYGQKIVANVSAPSSTFITSEQK